MLGYYTLFFERVNKENTCQKVESSLDFIYDQSTALFEAYLLFI
jgi:hypothetical protein